MKHSNKGQILNESTGKDFGVKKTAPLLCTAKMVVISKSLKVKIFSLQSIT